MLGSKAGRALLQVAVRHFRRSGAQGGWLVPPTKVAVPPRPPWARSPGHGSWSWGPGGSRGYPQGCGAGPTPGVARTASPRPGGHPGGLGGTPPFRGAPDRHPWGVRGVPPRPGVHGGQSGGWGGHPPRPPRGPPGPPPHPGGPEGGPGGVPGGPPGTPPGPGGPKSAHFFGYLITLPVGTKMGHFFGTNFGSAGTAHASGTTLGHPMGGP